MSGQPENHPRETTPSETVLPVPVEPGGQPPSWIGLIKRVDWRITALVLVLAVSLPFWKASTSHPRIETAVAAPRLPVVAVARVTRGDLFNEITIPAEFRPYAEVELHAKVSGYVQRINVDIGDQVKAGQLIAKLEVPELDDELRLAKATEARTAADYANAHQVYTRLVGVDKQNPNLVAQQELDTAQARNNSAEAVLAAAKAEVERYQTMIAYTRITAPFDGVITRRYADPGVLIQAGTASQTQSLPLVCVSDIYRLRLDFPVPIRNVKDVHEGDPVEVRVESLEGKSFQGTISRFSRKVDDATRTMLTEIEVPNPALELVPGMYAKLVLKVEKKGQALSVPTEAVSSARNPTVYLVNGQQQIEERPVTLGLETPTHYEVKSGLTEGDLVIVGNRSEVRPGEKVEAKLTESLAQK